jgi:hypothetical protein
MVEGRIVPSETSWRNVECWPKRAMLKCQPYKACGLWCESVIRNALDRS